MTLLIALIYVLVVLPLNAWVAGAIYFDAFKARPVGKLAAIGWFVAIVAIGILVHPTWIALLLAASLDAGFLAWWLTIKPTHDRDWRPELAKMPTAELDGDTVTIRNARFARYQSLEDITPHFEDRTYSLAKLRAMDIAVGNWGSIFMSHPFAIFEFEPDSPDDEPPRIGFSLEVRSLRGQQFSLFRNLFKQNELICVAADERDLLRRRIDHEKNTQIYLYRLSLRPETLRVRFHEYLDTINDLAETPRWYNGITTNCTTGVYRRYKANKPPFSWRVIVNGQLDAYLYELGILDQSLPFPELKEACHINAAAKGLPDEHYGNTIRQGRPGFDVITNP
ncbi:MAG: DUF4105 domain-containing protein, partial [Planctomycetota bacterium]